MKTSSVLVVLLAILAILTCLPDQAYAQQSQEHDQLSIQILDAQAKAVSGVQVSLILYRFNARGTSAEAIPAGSCKTDQDGRCQIMIEADAPKSQAGFLRGLLDLGERGKRSVIWPGGLFEMVIQLNPAGKLETEGEAAPFDYDPTGGVEVVQPQPPVYGIGILIGFFFLGLAFLLMRRSKAQ